MSLPATPIPIPILDTLAPLAATADAWISGIWGVLHNGVAGMARQSG